MPTQDTLRIAYLGPETTFTHQACLKVFSAPQHHTIGKISINDVFQAVETGEADYGVVPVENSTEGAVTITFDLFSHTSISIVREVFLEIHHNLIANCSLAEINKVYSHPQALGQCRAWLQENIPGADLIESTSTTAAAEQASGEANSAAIAGILAAQKYKLKILAENIEDLKGNMTRFLVLSKSSAEATGNDKTSIMFTLKHEAGALYTALLPFKENGVNMSMIQSRPSKEQNWAYVFFVDIVGHEKDSNVNRCLDALKEICQHLKVLGSYPRES